MQIELASGEADVHGREAQDATSSLSLYVPEDGTIGELVSQVRQVQDGPSLVARDPHTRTALVLTERPEGAITATAVDLDAGEEGTAQRMIEAWELLLEGLVAQPAQALSRISILTSAERRRVLQQFNDTAERLDHDRLLHELFEEQAAARPMAVAVIDGIRRTSYRELNARANRLAHLLRAQGVGPDQLVAICAERSTEIVVAVLAVLKAGGAYVPLDPGYPAQRLEFMMRDCAPRTLVTQLHLRGRVPTTAQTVEVVLESPRLEEYAETNLAASETGVRPDDLAYVIYTSGSTGLPKCAMNEHRGMVNRILSQQRIEKFSPDDICCQKTSFGFVDAVFEILAPLCHGLSLVVVPPDAVADPVRMANLIARERVTRLITVPSLARVMADDPVVMAQLRGLRTWTLSGEEVAPDLLARLQEQLPGCEFIDQYGSSEVSSDVACFRTRNFGGRRVPIGRPVPNTKVYVLDRHGEPVPTGVPGEIYVAGVNVGRGYRNRPDLTAERFVTDPFSAGGKGRMYRTGDIGRWRADGLLECLGRADRQVKIRGFRVELGEVEAQLLRLPEVREAAVVMRASAQGTSRILAYVTLNEPTNGVSEVAQDLRRRLADVLPEYMVPSAIVVMDGLPRTPNGKLDRHALPDHAVEAGDRPLSEAPQGDTETLVAGVWAELLGVYRVGRQDNFFESGGNSLLLMRLLERLRRANFAVDVSDVYDAPTLEAFARRLKPRIAAAAVPPNRIPADAAAITPDMLPLADLTEDHIRQIVEAVPGGASNVQDIYPLTPLQEGMLFHHLLDEQSGDAYVETILLSVSSRERIEDLIAAFQSVIDRHDILRTAVLWKNLPRPMQVVLRQATLPVEEIHIHWRRGEEAEQRAGWSAPGIRRLPLQQAPLLRLEVAESERRGEWYALLILHHMVDDDASLRIFISEVVAQLNRRGHELPEPVPYREHVAHALADARLRDADAFFRNMLGDVEEPTTPFGVQEVHRTDNRIESAVDVLPDALVERARRQVRYRRVSVAALFHAAWALVVAHTSGRDDVVFGTVLLGRLQGPSGGKQTIGMFVNTLPLRLQLSGVSAEDLVRSTRDAVVNLLAYEQASLAAAQRCSGIEGNAPLFSAVLNYRQGSVQSSQEWAGAKGVREIDNQYRTNYPVSVSIDDDGRTITLTAHTDARVAPSRVTAYLRTALDALLAALETSPRMSALALPILPADERQQVTKTFSPAPDADREHGCLTALFESTVTRTPDALAAVYAGQSLTFNELNRCANRVARWLHSAGVRPDDHVGLCVERGLETMVGIIGILKAGGAYVPLDPDYPQERLMRMIEGAAPRVLLTQQHLVERLASCGVSLFALDTAEPDLLRYPDSNLSAEDTGLQPSNLAYVIYTSGSTGIPKGVMIEHRHVASLWEALKSLYALSPECQNISVNASFTFDASVKQIIQILSGKTIFVVPQEVRLDATALVSFLRENRIHGIDCTPSQLKTWLAAGLLDDRSLALKVVLVGGEAIDPALWQTLASCEWVDFYNVYGPTECTVDATFARVSRDTTQPHIGRPLPNKRIYVLDRSGSPCPIGVAGEIHIGGAGIARGYLGDEVLTARRFVEDGFAGGEGRMYRSGDLGRWRDDGCLEYVGRADTQVKIRGFRIELGEIESQIRQHPGVNDVVVMARGEEPGAQRLVAYVAADHQDRLQPEESAEAAADMVAQWNKVHDDTYAAGEVGPSFVGWNSSYTGEPIALSEMNEWLDCTIEAIRACEPRRVLEIGCGVGLILQHIAPLCERYVATDFSAPAIQKLAVWLRGRNDLKQVELQQRPAHELGNFPERSFDTIILNSVVQYFPDIEYLVRVLEGAVRLLAPGGRVFVGDVRHLGLLSTFHSAVQLSRASASVRAEQLRKRVARAVTQDKELVIHPDFFRAVAARLPGFARAEICIKAGLAENELTRYRYDVVLYTSTATPDAEGRDVVARHQALLSRQRRRLFRDLAAQALIERGDPEMDAGAIRRRIGELELDETSQPAAFDFVPDTTQPIEVKPWRAYANDPLENGFRQQLIPLLREHVKARLPEYMVPSAWIVLKQLPLTPNGKIDRRALPDPESRPEELGEYVAPRTETERKLAEIWMEVLQVDRIGLEDDFFDLGGHSILAMQVIVRVRSGFGLEVPLSALFQFSTLRYFASRLDEIREERFIAELSGGGEEVDEFVRKVLAMPEHEIQALVGRMEMERGAGK